MSLFRVKCDICYKHKLLVSDKHIGKYICKYCKAKINNDNT